MALSPPNAGATLTGVRNQCARHFGISAYSSLSSQQQATVDDGISFGLDRVSREADAQWIRREGAVSTGTPYSTGTVDVTVGDATVSGTGTAWSSNLAAGDRINIGESGFRRIASITSDTELELDSAWTGDTDTAVTYEAVTDTYQLATGLLWLEDIRDVESAKQLIILSELEWGARTGGQYTTGTPEYGILRGADASGASPSGTNQKIQLWPLPDSYYAYVYTYLTVPTFPSTATDALEVYPHLSDLLVLAAMQWVWTQVGDVERATAMEASYQQRLVQAMRRETQRTGRQMVIGRPQWGVSGRVVSWPLNFPDSVSNSTNTT